MTGRQKSDKLTPDQHERLARFSRMVEVHLKRVGRAIAIRRIELGLSRPQLARLVPVADKTIERWEKGQGGGADVQLDRVAEVMNTTSQAMLAAALAEEDAAESEDANDDVLASFSPLPPELVEQLDRIEERQIELRKAVAALAVDVARSRAPTRRRRPPKTGEGS